MKTILRKSQFFFSFFAFPRDLCLSKGANGKVENKSPTYNELNYI